MRGDDPKLLLIVPVGRDSETTEAPHRDLIFAGRLRGGACEGSGTRRAFLLPNSNVPGETLDSPQVNARGSTMFAQLRYPEPKMHRQDAARHT